MLDAATGRSHHSLGAASSSKSYASSSGGETNYYDARDNLTGEESAAYVTGEEGLDFDDSVPNSSRAYYSGAVETSEDLQAAHDRAVAFYENAGYVRDHGNPSVNRQDKNPRRKARLPYHLTHETNVDSTTADETEKYEGPHADEYAEDTDDDFGFKFRPAIPPPRPLQTPGSQSNQPSLTLADTLSMKRSQASRPGQTVANPANVRSGILLETNIDSELDDNSSIPSSYYPDVLIKQPNHSGPLNQPPRTTQNGNLAVPGSAAQQYPSGRVAAFQFNTAVREEDETSTTVPGTPVAPDTPNRPLSYTSSGEETATEVGHDMSWSRLSGANLVALEEVPRMATWSSSRSPNSPSTVIDAGSRSPHYKSPAATSLSASLYSQTPSIVAKQQARQLQQQRKQQPQPQLPPQPQQPPVRQPLPPRMQARLDTDFEVSTSEADFSETTPQDMAILEYSRAIEEADRMRHAAAGNYVFAQPPGSHQFTSSVPEYINYVGRDSQTVGSVGLRAKSMHTLNTQNSSYYATTNTLSLSRNSLSRGSLSGNKALLTPGRARRESLRRSRLGLTMPDGEGGKGSVFTVRITDSVPTLASGNGSMNFTGVENSQMSLVPEVQHHGPLRSSSTMSPKPRGAMDLFQHYCADKCCPNASRKILFRGLLIGGIALCCIVLAVVVAVIVVATRSKDG